MRLRTPPDSPNSMIVFSRTRNASSLITTTAMLPEPVATLSRAVTGVPTTAGRPLTVAVPLS